MDEKRLADHISKISTLWSVILQAHRGSASTRANAQQEILERYQGAVYRYLFALTQDQETADELFQVFALKWVRGDFRRADPERGRFRDFLKTALVNLVLNHRKKQNSEDGRRRRLKDCVADLSILPVADLDEEFLRNWRKALLDRAWDGLAQESTQGTVPLFQALRYHSELPSITSEQLADLLTRTTSTDKPYKAPHVRKLLQRARHRFADLLLSEVVHSLPEASSEELHQELVDLGFMAHCQGAFAERFPG